MNPIIHEFRVKIRKKADLGESNPQVKILGRLKLRSIIACCLKG
jgi:hypothetical protein